MFSVHNTSISHLRNKKRKGENSVDNEEMNLNWGKAQVYTPQILEKEEAKKFLLQLIELLPANYRTVLTLFHLEEFSYKEIEEITRMPQGTIKSYLSRARKLLKEKMEKVVEVEKTNIFVEYE